MFNRGKTNQENSKEIGWNRSSDCFQDLVVERIPCLCRKERKKELELVSDPFLVDHFTGSLRNNTQGHFSVVFNSFKALFGICLGFGVTTSILLHFIHLNSLLQKLIMKFMIKSF